jgi:signal transduction histidine kinase
LRRISIKLGAYFFIFTLCIELLLFISLHYALVHSRVDEEIKELVARGNSHRDVLEKYFDENTIMHVALMESEAQTKVVITSDSGTILAKSAAIDPSMERHIRTKMGAVSSNGTVIEDDWQTSNYICSVSPIRINNETKGYVYMFLGTDSIQGMVDRLTSQFIIAGAVTVILTIITTFLLSRILTQPLIRMKQATEKMSKGDLSVTLDVKSNDEVGMLASSIQKLANDLDYMKKERSEFLASVAHELRTPLTYVKGYADIAMRETLPHQERMQYLSIIKEEAEHITRLVKDLFELAQLERHNFVIQKEQIMLDEFLRKVVAKVKPVYEEKQIDVSLKSPRLKVMIDEQRFEQVILNLLNNAYLHSNAGTSIYVNVKESEDKVLIEIKDEGEGIPKQDVPYIFERFYRVDKSRTRATGGSGLGLAIVKEIVELHGGRVSVESEIQKGSVFTIQLNKAF